MSTPPNPCPICDHPIDCTPYAKATPDAYATAALDAVRDALTSDDPQVVRAMAERVGLSVSTQEGFE